MWAHSFGSVCASPLGSSIAHLSFLRSHRQPFLLTLCQGRVGENMSLLHRTLQTAPNPLVSVAAKAKAKCKAGPRAKGKAKAAPALTRRRARIDLDEDVDMARSVAKEAKKVFRAKIVEQQANEKKMMRLTVKAAKLPPR